MIPVRTKLTFLGLLLIGIIQQSCTANISKQTYLSNCDADITFKHVDYTHLIDSPKYYDQQYIEISGRYQEGKYLSALFNDSLMVQAGNTGLWVNFSPDCPLYLSGTHVGFFEYSNDGFTRIHNKIVRLHGKFDAHNKGYHKQYKGCIDQVSFIEL